MADRLAEIQALHERLAVYRRKDSEGALVLNCTQVAARLMYDAQSELLAEVVRLREALTAAETERDEQRLLAERLGNHVDRLGADNIVYAQDLAAAREALTAAETANARLQEKNDRQVVYGQAAVDVAEENVRLRSALTALTAALDEMPDDIETIHSEFCSTDMGSCYRKCGERLARVRALAAAVAAASDGEAENG